MQRIGGAVSYAYLSPQDLNYFCKMVMYASISPQSDVPLGLARAVHSKLNKCNTIEMDFSNRSSSPRNSSAAVEDALIVGFMESIVCDAVKEYVNEVTLVLPIRDIASTLFQECLDSYNRYKWV